MTAAARVGQWVLYAVVVGVTLALSVWMVGWNPDVPLGDYALYAAVMAAPWLLAVRMLWRAWWTRTGTRLSTLDPAARLLEAAVAALPGDRRGWGAAMRAELAQVPAGPSRWRFAAGCLRTALLAPRDNRVPALVVAAVATAALVATGPAVGAILPAMRIFAVTFVALVGAFAVLVVVRSGWRDPLRSGRAVTSGVSGVVAVAACVGVTAYYLVRYPLVADYLSPAIAVFLAAALTVCLWLTVAPPRTLVNHRSPLAIGLGSALLLGAGLFLALRAIFSVSTDPLLWTLYFYLLPIPVMVIFFAATVAAAVGKSFGAGVQTAAWTALFASLLTFAIALFEALRWYPANSSETGPVDFVGGNLRTFIWGLAVFPFWWLPFGIIGAGLAAWLDRLSLGRPRPRPRPIDP